MSKVKRLLLSVGVNFSVVNSFQKYQWSGKKGVCENLVNSFLNDQYLTIFKMNFLEIFKK